MAISTGPGEDAIRGAGIVELRVRDIEGLFEPLDASPLLRRPLHEKVEQFIVHRAQEIPSADYRLVVRMAGAAPSAADRQSLSHGIREHFVHRAHEEGERLQTLIREARKDLLIGLVFLFICGALGLAALKLLPAGVGIFVEQGLLIIGWVALWRPADLFLYELRPLRKQRNTLSALSRMDVQFDR